MFELQKPKEKKEPIKQEIEKDVGYKGTIEVSDIFRLNEKFNERIVIITQKGHSLIGDKRMLMMFDLKTNERFSCNEDNFRKIINKKIKFK